MCIRDRAVGDQCAHRADDHALALAKLGSEEGDEQEGKDSIGNHGQSGNVALQLSLIHIWEAKQ